jgi:uncharacterized protein (TIGR02598 family)
MKTSPLFSLQSRAFSLVEVAIALGIVSFVLLAISGLVGVGLDASKSAQVDTLQAAAARTLLSSAATNEFGSLSPLTTYIDSDGMTSASTNGAVIKAVLSVVANPPGLRPEVVNDFQLLKIEFMYPAAAPASSQTTNIVYASRSR